MFKRTIEILLVNVFFLSVLAGCSHRYIPPGSAAADLQNLAFHETKSFTFKTDLTDNKRSGLILEKGERYLIDVQNVPATGPETVVKDGWVTCKKPIKELEGKRALCEGADNDLNGAGFITDNLGLRDRFGLWLARKIERPSKEANWFEVVCSIGNEEKFFRIPTLNTISDPERKDGTITAGSTGELYCLVNDFPYFGYYKNNRGAFKVSVTREPTAKMYPDEKAYLGSQPPKVGLALSGGGTRSASFSVGVLKGLQEKGLLPNVEVISSVSGGSYAAYWYMMQNYYLGRKWPSDVPEKQLNERVAQDGSMYKQCVTEFNKPIVGKGSTSNVIFCDLGDMLWDGRRIDEKTPKKDFKYQNHLNYSSNLLETDKEPGFWSGPINWTLVAGDLAAHVGLTPFHWLFNEALNFNINFNPHRHFYQNSLERTYGYVPLDSDFTSFANDDREFLIPKIKAKDLSFRDFANYLTTYKSINPTQRKLPYFIINATADYSGHFAQTDEKTLHDSVYEFTPWGCGSGLTAYTTSPDQCPDISIGRAVSISGAAIDGQTERVDQGGESKGTNGTLASFLKFVNWDLGYNVKNHNPNSSDSWLYKVLPWPTYLLADKVAGRYFDEVHLSDGGHIENLGVYSLVKRGVKTIIAVDAEEDAHSMYGSLKRLANNLKTEMGLDLVYDTLPRVYETNPVDAVIHGWIKGFVDENNQRKDLELFYIKLAVNKYSEYPDTLRDYDKDRFPHESTADINYSAKQYKAYRDLGYTIATKSYDDGILKCADSANAGSEVCVRLKAKDSGKTARNSELSR